MSSTTPEPAAARMYRRRETPRERLQAEVLDLVRDLGVQGQRVADDFAGSRGLHPTDMRALLHVMRREGEGDPMTTGELATALGLTSGAATGVVDRLERAGHLRRERDTADRRKVHLRFGEHGAAVAVEFFGPLGRRSDELMARYDDAELDVVRRFLGDMTAALEAHRPGAG
ncbi:MarR family transcriptional regulator [Paenibacillus sp. TRM 82003]|uniref:MarR family winged helix-turn-helix transcriptional regulator n=1 Tax=Kineococcus sp. TRM81007 TaxID=2925831 RepID=UPI001F5AA188|nr:MarR family transcriptional regulator [Kineococcus sp. TRM81007]MCI2237269.1 MarR family transcriptional regulator [Kineococcus sp. TRM81007]MCI3919328.1 MarR family transcriptional regulator [Paenibacillus sp. TRM 82003]